MPNPATKHAMALLAQPERLIYARLGGILPRSVKPNVVAWEKVDGDSVAEMTRITARDGSRRKRARKRNESRE